MVTKDVYLIGRHKTLANLFLGKCPPSNFFSKATKAKQLNNSTISSFINIDVYLIERHKTRANLFLGKCPPSNFFFQSDKSKTVKQQYNLFIYQYLTVVWLLFCWDFQVSTFSQQDQKLHEKRLCQFSIPIPVMLLQFSFSESYFMF